jgi:hypothetical protein
MLQLFFFVVAVFVATVFVVVVFVVVVGVVVVDRYKLIDFTFFKISQIQPRQTLKHCRPQGRGNKNLPPCHLEPLKKKGTHKDQINGRVNFLVDGWKTGEEYLESTTSIILTKKKNCRSKTYGNGTGNYSQRG